MKLAFLMSNKVMFTQIDPVRMLSSPRGLTGSEGSCVMYALAMVRRGHQVTVFTNCGAADVDGVSYRPYGEWEAGGCSEGWDAALSWIVPDGLRLANPSRIRLFNQQVNDFLMCPSGWEDWVDLTTSPSHSHARHLGSQTQFPRDRWRVMYNGVDCSQFRPGEKVRGKVLWASSHDRGLHWLLEAWPRIRAEVPDAQLHVFYNFDGCLKFASNERTGNILWDELGQRSRYVIECFRRFDEAQKRGMGRGIHLHKSVSRDRIRDEMASAEALAYPLDPANGYTEGFGVTVLEACASGVAPVLCLADAFDELWGSVAEGVPAPYSDHKGEFVAKIVEVLTNPVRRAAVSGRCAERAKQFDWAVLAEALELTLATRGQDGMPRVAQDGVQSVLQEVVRAAVDRSKWPPEVQVREQKFHGRRFEIVCIDPDPNYDHPSWFTFEDESELRDAVWGVRPGDVVLDVGAAYGSYALTALARGAARVYAWSPGARLGECWSERECLAESLRLNGWEGRCTLYDWGVYDRAGWLNMLNQVFRAEEFTAPMYEVPQRGGLVTMQTVIRVSTLDGWMEETGLPRCDWMKLDVEGAEVEALQGASNLLRRLRPKVLVENHMYLRASVEQEVRDFLKTVGYREVGTKFRSCGVSHSLFVPDSYPVDPAAAAFFGVPAHVGGAEEQMPSRDLSFRGNAYRVAYKSLGHSSWLSFEDEVSVRETFWHILPGEFVLDVGAWVGSYALPALACGAAHVYAWSPADNGGDGGEILLESLRMNQWDGRCTIYKTGLFNRVGWLDIETQKFSDTKEDGAIQVAPLDLWGTLNPVQRVDWLKLDVEGAEAEVLLGGMGTILKYRPKILVENHLFKRPDVEREVHNLLVNSGARYREALTVPYDKPGHARISHSLYLPEGHPRVAFPDGIVHTR